MPVSVVLADNEIMELIKPGEHGSTFGGNPLGAKVAVAGLKTIINEGMVENSRKMGDYMVKELKEMANEYDFVKDARGRGLFMAMEITPLPS